MDYEGSYRRRDATNDPDLAAEINAVARLTGSFKLRSGQVSTEYFDKYRFEGDPALLSRVARAMLDLLPPGTEVLAGLELGGVPIATAMSLASGLPAVFVRKQAKTYGSCKAVEGCDIAGCRVALFEDVITTGGAVADAARLVVGAGGVVVAVVYAIWRGEGSPRIAVLGDTPVLAPMLSRDLGRTSPSGAPLD